MKVRGIKRGQNIEVLEEINNIPDGSEIIIDLEVITHGVRVTEAPLTDQERLSKLNQLFGAWENQPELTEIFKEIDQQRHNYQGRNIEPIDHQENNVSTGY
ncbi:hypothetical protein NWP21_04880 [Anabaenopsis sp. FSS-46]|uniref:hypothetical protein n=1 Tax=Anabaenopsis sp. FSS-46 TaxID=2971766 RepID=UPI002476CD9F|nr:hypothetical protein [Anabaenopsis sp. FSS-46]MDH6098184.1 hypothetical protein [Anabaenopsis sp. FSS-46]